VSGSEAAVNLKRLFKLAETRQADLAVALRKINTQRPGLSSA